MGRSTDAIFAAAAVFAVTPAQASAWTRDDGRLFVSTKLEYFSAETGPESTFRRADTSTYAEFGLLERLAIGAKVNYGTSWARDPSGGTVASGFSEIETFAQRDLWRNENNVLSMRLGAIAPARPGSGARLGVASDGLSFEARAQYGRNITLRPIKIFASTEAGFRKNIGNGADEIRADITFGAEPSRRFLILLETYTVTSLRNEDNGGSDYSIYKGQVSLVWRASKRWRIQAGYSRELAGRNAALGQAMIFGLWSEF